MTKQRHALELDKPEVKSQRESTDLSWNDYCATIDEQLCKDEKRSLSSIVYVLGSLTIGIGIAVSIALYLILFSG